MGTRKVMEDNKLKEGKTFTNKKEAAYRKQVIQKDCSFKKFTIGSQM